MKRRILIIASTIILTALVLWSVNAYIETLKNPANRSLNTVYQNTTGKTIIVYLCATIEGSSSSQVNRIEAYLDSTSPPKNYIGEISNSDIDQVLTLTLIVPDQWYYKFLGVGSIGSFWWHEQTL